jgi:hypothetical protein
MNRGVPAWSQHGRRPLVHESENRHLERRTGQPRSTAKRQFRWTDDSPIVALYWFENRLFTYWFIKDVFPTLRKEKVINIRTKICPRLDEEPVPNQGMTSVKHVPRVSEDDHLSTTEADYEEFRGKHSADRRQREHSFVLTLSKTFFRVAIVVKSAVWDSSTKGRDRCIV